MLYLVKIENLENANMTPNVKGNITKNSFFLFAFFQGEHIFLFFSISLNN